MADRQARVIISGDDKPLDAALGRSKAKLSKWAKDTSVSLGRTLRGAFDGLGTIAGFGGIAGIAALGKGVMDFEKSLLRLRINAETSGANVDKLRTKIDELAVATGADRGELLAGISKIVEDTGNYDFAVKSAEALAKANVAAGVSMEDLGKLSSTAVLNLGILGDQMMQVFDITQLLGKKGAVEFKNLAGILPSVGAQWAKFGGSQGVGGYTKMVALMQGLKPSFGTAEEMGTGMKSLMTAVEKEATDRLQKIGVKVYSKDAKTGKKTMRPLMDILDDVNKKTKGDPTKIANLFGREEATAAYTAYIKNREEIKKFISAAGGASGEIEKDLKIVTESAGGKIAKTMAELKKLASESLAGHIDKIAEALKALMKVVMWFAAHPEALAATFLALKTMPGAFMAMGGGGRGGAGGGALALPGGGGGLYSNKLGGASGFGGASGGGAMGAGGKGASGFGGKPVVNVSGGLSFLDKLGAVTFAVAGGFTIGTLIAEKLGLNDKGEHRNINDFRRQGEFTRDAQYEFMKDVMTQQGPQGFADAADQDKFMSENARKGGARRWLALHPDFVGKDLGNMSVDQAFDQQRKPRDATAAAAALSAMVKQQTDPYLSSAQKVEVMISMTADADLLLRAALTADRKQRRSPK